MKVGIVSDHRGFETKQKVIKYLHDKGYNVNDYGTNSTEAVDYPDYGILIGTKVITKEVELGIAFCGTGIGISIACNKVEGIRCAKADNVEEAKQAREHLNANVIAINAGKELNEIEQMIEIFLTTPFSNIERHERRIEKLNNYEIMENHHEC